MSTTIILAKGRQPIMGEVAEPGGVSMVVPVPRGGLTALERDPLVAAFLENGATIVAEFEDAAETDLPEAKLTGRLQ